MRILRSRTAQEDRDNSEEEDGNAETNREEETVITPQAIPRTPKVPIAPPLPAGKLQRNDSQAGSENGNRTAIERAGNKQGMGPEEGDSNQRSGDRTTAKRPSNSGRITLKQGQNKPQIARASRKPPSPHRYPQEKLREAIRNREATTAIERQSNGQETGRE